MLLLTEIKEKPIEAGLTEPPMPVEKYDVAKSLEGLRFQDD
jgi:hypothetical protein